MALTTPATAQPARPDPASWRKAIGRWLREAREDAGLRLVDVARAARVSPQYLSEVERGRKEASSEVLQAVTGALAMTLVDLAGGVARDLARDSVRGQARDRMRDLARDPARHLARSGAPTPPVAVLHLSSVVGAATPGVSMTGTVTVTVLGTRARAGGDILGRSRDAVVGGVLLAA